MSIVYDDPEHVFMLCLCSDVGVSVFVFVFGQQYVFFVPQFVLSVCLCSGNGVRRQPSYVDKDVVEGPLVACALELLGHAGADLDCPEYQSKSGLPMNTVQGSGNPCLCLLFCLVFGF